MFFRL
jgi:hypothetical protein